MGEVIVVTSGKGGVGKTTTTANLGVSLSRTGHSVVMIDTDIGLRNLDVVMGLENRIVYNLVDVVTGICRLKQALIKDKRYKNLYLLPSAQSKDETSVCPEQIKKLTDELSKEYDYILIDCPAGIGHGFKNAIAGADSAIIVTTPEISSLRDADRINDILEKEGIINKKLIINRIRPEMIRKRKMMSPEDIINILDIELLGLIYDDENVIISSDKGEPLSEDISYAGQAYKNIAERICGNTVDFMKLYNNDSKLIKFFARLSGSRRDCV